MNWKRTFLAAFILVLCSTMYGQHDEIKGRSWAIKTGLGIAFSHNLNLEGEVMLSEQLAVSLRLGLIAPDLSRDTAFVEGYFFRFGPKFYLGEEKAQTLEGIAIKPEFMYSYKRDFSANERGVDRRYRNAIGGFVSVSYSLKIGKGFLIEPFVGAGYVRMTETTWWVPDTPPLVLAKGSPEVIESEFVDYHNTHLTIFDGLSATGGIQIGWIFN